MCAWSRADDMFHVFLLNPQLDYKSAPNGFPQEVNNAHKRLKPHDITYQSVKTRPANHRSCWTRPANPRRPSRGGGGEPHTWGAYTVQRVTGRRWGTPHTGSVHGPKGHGAEGGNLTHMNTFTHTQTYTQIHEYTLA